MLCIFCHFDLGTPAPRFCPRCGGAVPFADETDSEPDSDANGSEMALAPSSGVPDDISSGENAVLPTKKKWGHQIILLGIGAVAVVLALSGLLWAVKQRPPHPVLETETKAQVSSTPAQPALPPVETSPVPDTNSAPVTVTKVPPESVRYEVKSLSMPPSAETTPEESTPDMPATKTPPASSDWVGDMRRELAQCGGFFCREKVRWKYCSNRWNSVPECATGPNQ
jgi:hypothetical protein